jgi:hypothetical protein
MVKSDKPLLAKGKASAKIAAPKKSAQVAAQARPADLSGDQAKLASMRAGREKALKTRIIKSAGKKADAGGSSMAIVTNSLDKKYINDWLDERPFIVSYLASMLRNGLVEKSFNGEGIKTSQSVVGPRMVPVGSTRFRSIRGTVAVTFLATLFSEDLRGWFKGETKIPLELAQKALFKALGVTESTPLPCGHAHEAFFKPMEWIFKKRLKDIGNQSTLDRVTKENIDDECDWFQLSANGEKVMCNIGGNNGKVEVRVAIDMTTATDWAIVEPQNYAVATLVSEELGFEMLLSRTYEKQSGIIPTYNSEFHFAAGDKVPGCQTAVPRAVQIGGSTGSGTATQVADAFVAGLAVQAASPTPK